MIADALALGGAKASVDTILTNDTHTHLYLYITQMPCSYIMYFHINKQTQVLTRYGLMTPYGDMDLGQHWLR